MATDDVRISAWDLRASAGTTVSLEFTSTEALTSLAVYTGGTTIDVDDLTDATAHTATLSGGNLVATVEVDVPTGSSVPLRLVVDGAVQSVGRLIPSTSGTASPDNTITLTPGSFAFDLTVLGIVVNEGSGEGGGSDDQTAAQVPFTPTGTVAATNVQAAIAEVSGDVTTVDGRLDTIEADYLQTADIAGLQATSEKGQANGYAGLDATGVVPDGQLPAGLTRDSELTAAITAAIDGLLDGAPGALDTLNELAAAVNDDASFAASVTAALAGKQAAAAELTVLSGLSSSALGRTLLTIASEAAARTAIGLGNVDNTSDTAKPVSTAQQTALDAKAPLDSPTFTGTPAAPTPTAGDNTTKLATTAFVKTATDALSSTYQKQHGVPLRVTFDGGGSALTAGAKKVYLSVPYACTITRWRLLADQSGSVVVDIWKDTYANFPPVVGDTITASAKPTLSSVQKNESTALTGWTTSIAAGDILEFNIDSAATVTKVVLELWVTPT